MGNLHGLRYQRDDGHTAAKIGHESNDTNHEEHDMLLPVTPIQGLVGIGVALCRYPIDKASSGESTIQIDCTQNDGQL